MRVLVTAGGTREPIDGVRVVANTSTGRTGVAIAEAFVESGAEVVLVRASGVASALPGPTFLSVRDLDHALEKLLRTEDFDVIVHAAAVSDFVVDAVVVDGVRYAAPLTHKLDSAAALSVTLVPGKKLLPYLKTYSRNPHVLLIGFKLTDGASPAEIEAAVLKVLRAGADLVVHNEVRDVTGETGRRAGLWDRSGLIATLADGPALSAALIAAASKSSS